jgi:hypothetical protein
MSYSLFVFTLVSLGRISSNGFHAVIRKPSFEACTKPSLAVNFDVNKEIAKLTISSV